MEYKRRLFRFSISKQFQLLGKYIIIQNIQLFDWTFRVFSIKLRNISSFFFLSLYESTSYTITSVVEIFLPGCKSWSVAGLPK